MAKYLVYVEKKKGKDAVFYGEFSETEIIQKGLTGEIGEEFIVSKPGLLGSTEMKAADLPGFPKGVPKVQPVAYSTSQTSAPLDSTQTLLQKILDEERAQTRHLSVIRWIITIAWILAILGGIKILVF